MVRLSKVETYAILWLSSTGLDSASISKELKLPEDKIIKVLEKKQPRDNENKIKTGSEPVQGKNLMINETAGKRNKTVSIMTGAASSAIDNVYKNMPLSNKHSGSIFKPNNG